MIYCQHGPIQKILVSYSGQKREYFHVLKYRTLPFFRFAARVREESDDWDNAPEMIALPETNAE